MQFAAPETETASPASRWTSRIALFALGIILTTVFLHRLFGMPTAVAFNLVLAALGCAVLSIGTGLIAAIGIWRHGSMGTARVVFGVLLSIALLTGPLMLSVLARDYPPINDLTTDTRAPPAFQTLAKARSEPGANPAAYPGERFANEQARAYPDIKPMLVNRSSAEAFELVVEAVRKLKMEIVREEGPTAEGGEGAIEAVDRTIVVGFYDDVAIRVTGSDESARIDIRSAARFGRTDFGANAERVRALMKEIVTRLESTVPVAEGAAPSAKKAAADPAAAKRGQSGDAKSMYRRKSRVREQ
jgi:uncharacterized protein (DUF1499 family)